MQIFACAAAALLMGSTSSLAAPPDDLALADTLAMQSAMQQAREHLLHNRPREAVNALHRELGHINGNPVYLALLRDAYQAAIKELQLAHQEAEAQRYVKWLAILEPGRAPERNLRSPSPKSSQAASSIKQSEKDSKRLDALIEEATVDCYDVEEQHQGLACMIEENVVCPFPAKVIGDGLPLFRDDGKVIKPEGWTAPDIAAAIS